MVVNALRIQSAATTFMIVSVSVYYVCTAHFWSVSARRRTTLTCDDKKKTCVNYEHMLVDVAFSHHRYDICSKILCRYISQWSWWFPQSTYTPRQHTLTFKYTSRSIFYLSRRISTASFRVQTQQCYFIEHSFAPLTPLYIQFISLFISQICILQTFQ